MRRKLIKQGKTGLTIYLPKKWVDEKELNSEDEVDIEITNEGLLINPTTTKKRSEITIQNPGDSESMIRTVLVNAYRSGFDKIIIEHKNEKLIHSIVQKHLLGFETFKQKNNEFSIESVAEPSFEEFDRLVEKILFILIDIIKELGNNNIVGIEQIQKYDNFLKRAISKNILTIKTPFQSWSFLSNLVQIGRQAHHLHKFKEKEFSSKEKELISLIDKMIHLVQKAYLKKNTDSLQELHEVMNKEIYNIGFNAMKTENPVNVHYLITIARNIYLSNSALIAIIQSNT